MSTNGDQETKKLPYRIMKDMPISKSFKGILRIGAIKPLVKNQKDIFLNPTYYGETNSLITQKESYEASAEFLGAQKRYYSSDAYKNKKVPITDSLGNFLNIFIGEESITYGYTENTAKINDSSIINSLRAETLHPVSLKLDSLNNESYLIVNNNYSAADIDSTTKKYSENSKSYRTVFNLTNNKITKNDVLMHHQVDCIKNGNTYDSYINVVDLEDYINDAVTHFRESYFVEMPTGSVIWQFVDLNNWYSAKGNSENIYKRDYLLCDGSTFYMQPWKCSETNSETIDKFLDLFYCIGYEYTESSKATPRYATASAVKIYSNLKDNLTLQDKIAYSDIINKFGDYINWREVYYTIDMLRILAYKLFREEYSKNPSTFKDERGNFVINYALEWLKNQDLPEEYIINTYKIKTENNIFKEKNGNLYPITITNKNTITNESINTTLNLNLGTMISKFNEEISYPVFTNANKLEFHDIPAYKIPEIYDIFKIYANYTNKSTNANTNINNLVKKIFQVKFQVPNFNITKGGTYGYKTGGFISTNGIEQATIQSSNTSYTFFEKIQNEELFNKNHRHFLMIDRTNNLDLDTHIYDKNKNQYLYYIDRWNTEDVCKEPKSVKDGMLLGSFRYPDGENYHNNGLSYFIDEINDGLSFVKNKNEGVCEIQISGIDAPNGVPYGTGNSDYRYKNFEPCRGPMSPPKIIIEEDTSGATAINTKKTNLQSTLPGDYTTINFFQPEAIQMLPLIKL